jgi:hypothetical protein
LRRLNRRQCRPSLLGDEEFILILEQRRALVPLEEARRHCNEGGRSTSTVNDASSLYRSRPRTINEQSTKLDLTINGKSARALDVSEKNH